jgi:hypothetical protein
MHNQAKNTLTVQTQGWIYWRGYGGVCTPLALARRVAGGGVLFFIISKKLLDKMRYSNLSNNMMISEL